MIPRSAVTSIGVRPPPRCAPMKKIPCAVPRSAVGNQREMALAELGHAPASPAPKRKRMASSELELKAAAVAMVKLDHQITIRVSTLRGPIRSPHHPVGISKIAYES